jgi:transposase
VIGLSRRVRVFAYTRPVDMRKQYDGLYALVVAELKADPLSGDLFLFTNRRRTRAKVLLWDGTGLCLSASWRSSSKAVHWLVPSDSPRRRPPRKF